MSNQIKNITGMKFGRLTVLEFSHIQNRTARWRCICDCGKKKIASGVTLRNGCTQSCGCIQKEITSKRTRKTEYGATCANDVFCYYKNHAIKDDREFLLSKEEFLKLIINPCKYCGKELTNERKSPRSYGSFKYTGIDRIDSSKGYTKENSISCCSMCNFMKRHHDVQTFLNHVKLIVEYNKL